MGTISRRKGRKYWQIQYVDARGKRVQKSSKTTDKATANQLLVSLEIHTVQTIAGVRNQSADLAAEYARQPIKEWIDAFIASLEVHHGRNNEHVEDTRNKIDKIVAKESIRRGPDITADAITRYTTNRQKAENLSARTIQSYIVAIKAFTIWCVQTGRLLSDPIAIVKAPSPVKDRRYVRRALTREEWVLLRAAAETGPEIRKIPGPERALLYELALVTGLRAEEINGLKRSSVVFDAPTPYLILPATDTKNNKPAEQLLTKSLAAKLKAHLKLKHRGVSVFGINDLNRLAIVLRKDMDAARHKWINEPKDIDERNKREASDFLRAKDSEKRNVDFHALRYTCGAWLALGGIHAKQIQKMMRHSTIRLTLDTYGHLFPEQQSQAMEVIERATA
jgi:integrase